MAAMETASSRTGRWGRGPQLGRTVRQLECSPRSPMCLAPPPSLLVLLLSRSLTHQPTPRPLLSHCSRLHPLSPSSRRSPDRLSDRLVAAPLFCSAPSSTSAVTRSLRRCVVKGRVHVLTDYLTPRTKNAQPGIGPKAAGTRWPWRFCQACVTAPQRDESPASRTSCRLAGTHISAPMAQMFL